MEKDPTKEISIFESLVEQSKAGSKEALDQLVRRIQDRIYGLALRMLYLPADAEDATQEILIKIITHLDGFRKESRFTTWVFRIASNHLLTMRKGRAERWGFTFERYEQGIDEGVSMEVGYGSDDGEKALILQEVKLSCMQGMLLCLSREVRLAFILGEIFGVTSVEGGEILKTTPEAFRQRLSRGRKEIHKFMDRKCGLMNPENPCRCRNQVNHDVKIGLIDPQHLLFADHPRHQDRRLSPEILLQELDQMGRVAFLFRSHPDYSAPEVFVDVLRKLVESGRFKLMSEFH